MAATKQLTQTPAEDVASVQIDGRSYLPQSRGGKNRKSNPRIRQDRVQYRDDRRGTSGEAATKKPSHTEQVAIDLFESVWASMPLAGKTASDFSTSEEIVPSFFESFGQLKKYEAQAKTLVETLCHYHVQAVHNERLDRQRQREAQESKIRECMPVSVPSVLLGKELDVKTLAKQREIAFAQLRDSLRRNVAELVESFFLMLEQLVNKEVVGLIEWRSDSLCRFHFFRRLVTHVSDGQSVEEREADYWRQVDGRTVALREKSIHTTTKWREIHELIRHEQQLMKASKRPLDSPGVAVPEEIRRVAASIPAWLSPFVRVAVGDCFRERIIRHAEKEKHWEDTKVNRRVFERPVLYYDPAITIGEFVLLGWGRREEEHEKQRRTAFDALAIAGALFAVGFFLLVSTMLSQSGLAFYGWATIAVSSLPFNIAVGRYARWCGRQPTLGLFLATNTIAVSSALSLVAGALAVLSRSWIPAVIVVLLLAFVIPVGLFALWRQWFGLNSSAAE
jgi:hypothetical protein